MEKQHEHCLVRSVGAFSARHSGEAEKFEFVCVVPGCGRSIYLPAVEGDGTPAHHVRLGSAGGPCTICGRFV